MPVRLLTGDRSPAYFRPAAEAIASHLPAAEVVVLPGQAHMAINEAPDLFVAQVLQPHRKEYLSGQEKLS